MIIIIRMTRKCTATEIADVSCTRMNFEVREEDNRIVVSAEGEDIVKVGFDEHSTGAYEIWKKVYVDDGDTRQGFVCHFVTAKESKLYRQVKGILTDYTLRETDVSVFAEICKKVKNLSRKMKFESVKNPQRAGTYQMSEKDDYWSFMERRDIGNGTVYVCKHCGKDMLNSEWGRHKQGDSA